MNENGDTKNSDTKNLPTQNSPIMSPDERRQLLSQIARGEITLLKPVVINKEIKQVECPPDYTDRKNAIVELNRMDGIYKDGPAFAPEQILVIRPVDE